MNWSNITIWGSVRTRRFEIICALTFLVTLVLVCSVGLSVAQDEKPKKETVEQLVKRYETSSHQRYCGAKLTITAKRGKDFDDRQECHIDWSIDYNGPRPPFCIFKPSMDYRTAGKTRIDVFREWGNDAGVMESGHSPVPSEPSPYSKDEFVTSVNGKPVTGVMTVLFGGGPRRGLPSLRFFSGKIYLRLSHAPVQRGWDEHDAWVGELVSNITELKSE